MSHPRLQMQWIPPIQVCTGHSSRPRELTELVTHTTPLRRSNQPSAISLWVNNIRIGLGTHAHRQIRNEQKFTHMHNFRTL
jgi:predicted transcriptional regulator